MRFLLFIVSFLLILFFAYLKLSFNNIEPLFRSSLVGIVDTFSLLAFLSLGVFLFAKDKQPFFQKNTKFSWPVVIPIIAIVFTLGIALYLGFNKKALEWDSVALYDARAQFLNKGINFSEMVSLSKYDDKNQYYYLLYPPFTSLAHFAWYQNEVPAPVSLQYPLQLVILSIIVFLFSTRYLGTFWGSVLTFVSVASRDVFYSSTTGYTNLPFSLYLISSIFLISYYFESRERWSIIFGSLLLGTSLWIRFLEPVWVAVVLAMLAFSFFEKAIKKNIKIIIFVAFFCLFQYLSWQYFVRSISNNPAIFKFSPLYLIEPVLGMFTGSFINVLYFFIISWKLTLFVHIVALFKFDKREKPFFGYIRMVIVLSIILYFCGLYFMSFVFDWWREIGSSMVRSASYIIPLSAFLLTNNLKLIMDKYGVFKRTKFKLSFKNIFSRK